MKRLLVIATIFIIGSLLSAAEYDRILAELNKIVDKKPAFVQMIDIGQNDQGQTIYGLRMENPNFSVEDGKSNHLIVGTHHGNERLSADLCVNFANKLLASLENSADSQHKALSSSVFYVIPVLNIGGFNANRRSERDTSGRYLDPNRDYPDACVKNTYFRLASIRNLVNFVERQNIVGAVTVHGYIGTFTYPWGIYTNNTKTLDHNLYHHMGSKSVQANSYRTGTHTDVIYPAAGAFEDWAYHKHGIWTMLLELRRSPNFDRDSNAVMCFFSMVPTERSNQHQHTGNCTAVRGEAKSRP